MSLKVALTWVVQRRSTGAMFSDEEDSLEKTRRPQHDISVS